MSHIEDRTGVPIATLVAPRQIAVGLGLAIAGAALALVQLA